MCKWPVLLLILLLSFSAAVRAQKSTLYRPPLREFSIRITPSALIDPQDLNLLVGSEYMLNSKWSVGGDLGWVYYSGYFPHTRRANGFIIRPALRRYWSRSGGFFTEAVLHYKHVSYELEDWLGRNAVNNVPAYEEYTRFRYRKNVSGLHINAGFLFPVSSNRRFWLEFYGGLGMRYKTTRLLAPEGSFYRVERFILPDDDPPYQWLPAFPGGLRLIYQFSK